MWVRKSSGERRLTVESNEFIRPSITLSQTPQKGHAIRSISLERAAARSGQGGQLELPWFGGHFLVFVS